MNLQHKNKLVHECNKTKAFALLGGIIGDKTDLAGVVTAEELSEFVIGDIFSNVGHTDREAFVFVLNYSINSYR